MISFICKIQKKKTHQIQRYREKTRGWQKQGLEGGEWKEWVKVVKRCKLVVIRLKSTRDITCSMVTIIKNMVLVI